MKIRIAVTPPPSALTEDAFPEYLALVETLGFDTLWLSDIPLGPLGDPLVALAFAAGQTSRLKLGANIVPLGRNPLWLAKQLAHLDRLSKGRLLLSFVPGLAEAGERQALGYAERDRGKGIEATMDLLRRWWANETVSATFGDLQFDEVRVAPLPVQQPLEVWLGGKSKLAIDRVARYGDGWLTAAMTPSEAAVACQEILERAANYERDIDPEHFGISLPYSLSEPAPEAIANLEKRRKDGDVSQILAIGTDGLVDRLQAYEASGLSKFVVRSVDASTGPIPWREDLPRLAEAVLPLQT